MRYLLIYGAYAVGAVYAAAALVRFLSDMGWLV